MKRREFIAGLGAAGWPVVARAQQGERLQRVAVLMGFGEDDPQGRANFSAFMQGLLELGWVNGRNVRIDARWEGNSVDRMQMLAKELVDLKPDVIVVNSTPETAAFQRETQTIPIIFVGVSDPIGSGFVAGLARPGGNITGFMVLEASMGGKWLQLLTEIAAVKRVTAMFNPDTAPYVQSWYLPSLEGWAKSLNVALVTAPVRNDTEIEMVINALEPREDGLIAMPDGFMIVHRGSIISAAARNKVPAVYWLPIFVADGGLLSYGPDFIDIFRRSASYVDRILPGAKPADLPVQLPARFQMVLNARTAKELGLDVPPSILVRADEVIE